jgi:MFS family permease
MRPLVPELPRKAWFVLGGDTLSAIGTGLTLPFLVVYLNRVRGVDLELAGAALATIAFAALPGNPAAGVLIDRLGSRRTLTGGLLLAAAGAAAMAFVSRPWEAFAAAATLGFGLALVWPAQHSLLAVTVGPQQRSNVFAVRHATMNTGLGIGGLVAALLVDFDSTRSFQALYLLDAASFTAFASVLTIALRGVGGRPKVETREVGRPTYRAVVRDRVFLRLLALVALLVAAGYAQFNAAFPAYATGPGGISAGALALAFAVNTISVSLLQLPALHLVRGHRRTALLVAVFALSGATWAVTLIAGELGGGVAAVAVFASAAAIFALGETLMSPAVAPMANDLAPERLRGRYNALYTLSWTTGFILGPLIAGAALGTGHARALFLSLIVACVAGALGTLRLRGHLPPGVDIVGTGTVERE